MTISGMMLSKIMVQVTDGGRQSVWASDGRALQYFAEYVYETDLKKGGLDAAGKSWDDPKVNGGKQTIGTFTIGFGSGLSNNGKVLFYHAVQLPMVDSICLLTIRVS